MLHQLKPSIGAAQQASWPLPCSSSHVLASPGEGLRGPLGAQHAASMQPPPQAGGGQAVPAVSRDLQPRASTDILGFHKQHCAFCTALMGQVWRGRRLDPCSPLGPCTAPAWPGPRHWSVVGTPVFPDLQGWAPASSATVGGTGSARFLEQEGSSWSSAYWLSPMIAGALAAAHRAPATVPKGLPEHKPDTDAAPRGRLETRVSYV